MSLPVSVSLSHTHPKSPLGKNRKLKQNTTQVSRHRGPCYVEGQSLGDEPNSMPDGISKTACFGVLLSLKLMAASLANALVLLHVPCYVYGVDIQFRAVHGLLKTQVAAGQDSRQDTPASQY